MRVESSWTPRGIALWLIAAILATLAVWAGTRPDESDPPAEDPAVEFEVVD